MGTRKPGRSSPDQRVRYSEGHRVVLHKGCSGKSVADQRRNLIRGKGRRRQYQWRRGRRGKPPRAGYHLLDFSYLNAAVPESGGWKALFDNAVLSYSLALVQR